MHLHRIGKLTVCVGFIKVSLAFSCPFFVKYDKRIYKIRLKAHFIFLMRLGVHSLQSESRHYNFSGFYSVHVLLTVRFYVPYNRLPESGS